MTLKEAQKIAMIVSQAHGQCSECVMALADQCREVWPQFDWRDDESDPYTGNLVRVFKRDVPHE